MYAAQVQEARYKCKKVNMMLNTQRTNNQQCYNAQKHKIINTIKHSVQFLQSYKHNLLQLLHQHYTQTKQSIMLFKKELKHVYHNELTDTSKINNVKIEKVWMLCEQIESKQIKYCNVNVDLSCLQIIKQNLVYFNAINLHIKSIESQIQKNDFFEESFKTIKQGSERKKKKKLLKNHQIPTFTIHIDH